MWTSIYLAGIALTAALLIIGDEILAGKVDDTNSSYLCRELYALGWRVVKVCLATYYADLHNSAQTLSTNRCGRRRRLCFQMLTHIVCFGQVVCIRDEVDAISSEVRALSEAYDVVVTSGGLGPTPDDVTMAGVAEAFGHLLVRQDSTGHRHSIATPSL